MATATNDQAFKRRFHDLLTEIGELHNKKQEDYGSIADPAANIRQTAEWAVQCPNCNEAVHIPPWVGAMIRASDKMVRLRQLAARGSLTNEGARDSFVDLAVHSLLGLLLYEDDNEERYGITDEGIAALAERETSPDVPAIGVDLPGHYPVVRGFDDQTECLVVDGYEYPITLAVDDPYPGGRHVCQVSALFRLIRKVGEPPGAAWTRQFRANNSAPWYSY